MAATTTTNPNQTQGFLATSTRKLRPKFMSRTNNQHWRTSTSLATSSPLSPLHERQQTQQQQEQQQELGRPANTSAPHPTTNQEPLAEIRLPPHPFPRWIRLKAIADFKHRQELTTQVAEAISATSGGFIAQSNMLSDMVTVLVLEDVHPQKLAAFEERLDSLNGVTLDETSREILNDCNSLLKLKKKKEQEQKGESMIVVPDTATLVVQLNWRNAPGSLRHEIPMDG